MSVSTRQHALVIVRSTLLGTSVGLLIGLYEAAYLYCTPRPPLLQPDVSYVIWFVAPLVDAILGFVGGLVVGWLKGNRHPIAKGVAATLGATGALVASGVGALALRSVTKGQCVPASWLWMTVALGSVFLAAYLIRQRVQRFFQIKGLSPIKTFATAILAGMVVLLSGIVFFVADRSVPAISVEPGSLPPETGRPNVVLITLDTVRADHLSVYGYSRSTSPNLERWARQGVVFDKAVAASSWTLASHASMFTGLLPHQHGADWVRPMDTSRWTLAEVLRSRGYETAGFTSNLHYGEAGWGLGKGFEVYEDTGASLRHNLRATLAGNMFLQPLYSLVRHDDLDRRRGSTLNHEVVRWFGHRSGNPFFLFVNYFDAHSPYFAPAPYDKRFGQASKALLDKARPIMDRPDLSNSMSDQDRQSLINAYDNCLAYMDDQVGQLLLFLAKQPEWSNTVVIITSDHGEAFGEHGAYSHGWTLHREVVHVPLIIFGPGVPKGMRIAHTASVRKLFSTVLDLTLGERQPFSGSTLRRFWTPGVKLEPFDDIAISELASRTPLRPSSISLVTSQWHYIEDSQRRRELYSWNDASDEKVNQAESNPEKVRELGDLLREYTARSLAPWTNRRYLSPLQSDSGSLDLPAVDPKGVPNQIFPIGISQAYFPPEPSRTAMQRIPDEELLQSLPYQ